MTYSTSPLTIEEMQEIYHLLGALKYRVEVTDKDTLDLRNAVVNARYTLQDAIERPQKEIA
jgi:hypothetical protein